MLLDGSSSMKLNFISYDVMISACENAAQPEQVVDKLLVGSTRH